MKDYSLGNRICAFRTSLCLSQYQLGALVGVSDKAVSKWENGSAKPRMGTCRKLAAVFQISLDELLSCNAPIEKTDEDERLAETFWTLAEQALHDKYGPTPPIACVGRLQSERAAIKSVKLIRSLLFLSTLGRKAKAAGCSVSARGMLGSWFSLWLLDGSNVNPLPPHYYCPHCHRTEFVYSAKDGWDLPEKKCCGISMLRDGHRIPFEGHLSQTAARSPNVEVNIPVSFLPTAELILQEVYAKTAQIVKTRFADTPDNESMTFYTLLPLNHPAPALGSHGVWIADSETYWKQGFDYVMLYFSKKLETLRKAQIYASRESVNTLISPENLRNHYLQQIRSLPEISAYMTDDRLNFSTVLKIEGFLHGAQTFIENGEKLVRNGDVKFEDLLSLREDVWDMILAHLEKSSAVGVGFALKIMEEARKGYYGGRYHGIPEDTLRLLREIRIPEWCITQLSRIQYMFPRAHCIELLIEKLQLLQMNCREQ